MTVSQTFHGFNDLWSFEEYRVRNFVECCFILICLYFNHDLFVVMEFWGARPHSSIIFLDMSGCVCNCNSSLLMLSFNLHQLAEVMFVGLLLISPFYPLSLGNTSDLKCGKLCSVSLKGKYLHKLFWIFLYGKVISCLPPHFIYLSNYLYQHGTMTVILWVKMQSSIIYFVTHIILILAIQSFFTSSFWFVCLECIFAFWLLGPGGSEGKNICL